MASQDEIEKQLEAFEEKLKGMFEGAVSSAMKTAVIALPLLGWPVFKALFKFAVGKFKDMVFEEIAKRFAVLLIDVKVESQKRAYNKAVEELRQMLDHQKEVSDEEKQKVIGEYDKRLADLINFGV